MRPETRTGLALLAALALSATAEAAYSRTDPEQIRAVAERYVRSLGPPGGTVHATAGRLDPRLNLAPCAGELTPSLPAGADLRSRTVVTVRCPDLGGWALAVPVAIESEVAVLVARRPLTRGEIPSAGDLERTVRRVPGLGTQYLLAAADTSGRRLRHPIAIGQPVTTDALQAPVLVERGQQVTVVAELAGIAVRAGGIALDAGGHGDRVRARSLSGRIVQGVVQADGTLAAGP